MYRINKSVGYYLKKYNELREIIKGHANWFNDCSDEQNLKAKNAIIEFYLKYKECKPDKKYCIRPELGHFSYLIYLIPIRNSLKEHKYQRACNEIYSLLHYDYFLQKRIFVNLTNLLEKFLECNYR